MADRRHETVEQGLQIVQRLNFNLGAVAGQIHIRPRSLAQFKLLSAVLGSCIIGGTKTQGRALLISELATEASFGRRFLLDARAKIIEIITVERTRLGRDLKSARDS